MTTNEDTVTLKGGPFNNVAVARPSGRSLQVFGDSKKVCARYRQGRDRDTFTFRGMERIVVTMPKPGAVA